MRWSFEYANSDDYVIKCEGIEVGFFMNPDDDEFVIDQGAISCHEPYRAIEIEGIARWMVDALNEHGRTHPFDPGLLLAARQHTQ